MCSEGLMKLRQRIRQRPLSSRKSGKSVCGKTCDVVTEDRISEFFGVRAVIGEMQTPLGVYQDVIPVSIGCRE